MEDPDISSRIQQFNIDLIRDVNNFMRRGTAALKELKNKVANEHEQKQKLLLHRRLVAPPSDLNLIFQSIEAFNKQKQELKVDAETTLKQFSESWESALGVVLEVMLQKFVKKVDYTSLTADDFKKTQISSPRNIFSGGASWQNAVITDDDTDVIEEEHITRRSLSPINIRRQVGGIKRKQETISPAPANRKQIGASLGKGGRNSHGSPSIRRNLSQSFQHPISVDLSDSEDSESSVEIQEEEEPIPSPALKKTRKSVPCVRVSVPIDGDSPTEVSVPSPPSRRTRGRLSTPAMTKKKDADVISLPAQKKRKSVTIFKPPSTPSPSKSALWIPLNAISDRISNLPHVYQLKVHQAKKPAFIGYCSDLQSIISKYKNGESTGKKQLDKFIQRNLNNIEIQSETCSSVHEAKQRSEEMLAEFAKCFNNRRPVYNN